MAANPKGMDEAREQAWRGFKPGPWQKRVNVRDFIQRNYTPYEGDASFLAGPTDRSRKVWETLTPLLAEERDRGVLAVSQVPSSILAHEPGYIAKDLELIVGLQTDAPIKRAIMPKGGWRMVETSLQAYGFEPDQSVKKIFTEYLKTHNDGVFDAYTPEIRKCRSSGIVTGLPDAYGRGRIIGDYRRPALYGLDVLIEEKRAEPAQPHRRLVATPARRLQALRGQVLDRHELHPVHVRRHDAPEVRRRRRHRLLRVGDAGGQARHRQRREGR